MAGLSIFKSIDAVVTVRRFNTHYFFSGGKYFRFDISRDNFERKGCAIGTPDWKGVWHDVDAAIFHPKKHTYYFFKGDKYQRYIGEAAEEPPRTIGIDGWKGVWHNIDAARVVHPDGLKVYFFKGGKYQRYDFGNGVVWEKPINHAGQWQGVWHDIDAAVVHPPSLYGTRTSNAARAYFFKGNQYQRYIFGGKVDKEGTMGEDGWRLRPKPAPGQTWHASEDFRCTRGDWETTEGIGSSEQKAIEDLRADEARMCHFTNDKVKERKNLDTYADPTS